jgi:hypothetical protein
LFIQIVFYVVPSKNLFTIILITESSSNISYCCLIKLILWNEYYWVVWYFIFTVSILSCKNGKFTTGNWLSIFITYFHIDKFRFLLHTTRDGLYYIKWCKNLLNPDNFTQLYFPCFSCKKILIFVKQLLLYIII